MRSKMDFQNKQLITLKEFQDWASVSHSTVYRLINSGKLKAVKGGKRTFITKEAANDYLASLEPVMPATKAD